MRQLVIALTCMLAIPAFAQNTPQTQNQTEHLTVTEQTALNALASQEKQLEEQMTNLRQQVQLVLADISEHHKGYHLDIRSMQLVKDTEPTPKPTK